MRKQNLGQFIWRSASIVLMLANMSCSGPTEDGAAGARMRPIIQKPSTNPDILQIGETLEIFVMEDIAFNGSYKIREKGDIILPKIGRILVAGLTLEAAQARIQQALQDSQLTKATVIADRVSKVGGTKFEEVPKMLVFVTGKVNMPGQHMIAMENGKNLYAYEAILIAGGTNSFADERKAYILRKGDGGVRQKIPLDIRAIRQGSANDIALTEGDMIFVPERRFAL